MLSKSQDKIVEYLQRTYHAHTIIAYGSNTAMSPDRDVDLLVLSNSIDEERWPARQPSKEFEFRRNWVARTLKRTQGGDVKSIIRQHEIFTMLLQQYFQNKKWWYEGATAASQRMQSEDPEAYRAFLDPDLHRLTAFVFPPS